MVSNGIDILVVEDDPNHVVLITEALALAVSESGSRTEVVHVVNDGLEALTYLRREGDYSQAKRPDLILLDLNLPRMNGHDVLDEIKGDDTLRTIPVVVLTTSDSKAEIRESYQQRANSYVTKPLSFDEFVVVMKAIHSFWLETVLLPHA